MNIVSARSCAPRVAGGRLWRQPVRALAQRGEVNVYTYRESKLIQPLFEAFTKDTGIKVNVISASSGLEQRIKTEGANSPADVLLTVDIGRLEDAVQAGITQPIKSAVLDKAVPAQYRDPEGHWYGISMRARVRLRLEGARASRTRSPTRSSPTRSGRARSASAPASTSTTTRCSPPTSRKHGAAKAEEWLKGLKANLAQKPSGGDRESGARRRRPANATSASATPITGR